MTTKKTPVAKYEAHTAKTKFGMGDYYGTGVRNPAGKTKGSAASQKKLGKPPKSLA